MSDHRAPRDIWWTVLSAEQLPASGPDEAVWVGIMEQYEIIDSELPYEQRFRTLRWTLDVHTDSYDDQIEVDLTPTRAVDLGRMLLRFGLNNERRPDR